MNSKKQPTREQTNEQTDQQNDEQLDGQNRQKTKKEVISQSKQLCQTGVQTPPTGIFQKFRQLRIENMEKQLRKKDQQIEAIKSIHSQIVLAKKKFSNTHSQTENLTSWQQKKHAAFQIPVPDIKEKKYDLATIEKQMQIREYIIQQTMRKIERLKQQRQKLISEKNIQQEDTFLVLDKVSDLQKQKCQLQKQKKKCKEQLQCVMLEAKIAKVQLKIQMRNRDFDNLNHVCQSLNKQINAINGEIDQLNEKVQKEKIDLKSWQTKKYAYLTA